MMPSKSSGFLTEVEIFSASKPRAKSQVPEEEVIQELAEDFSAYMRSSCNRARPFTRDVPKEALLNSLAARIQSKQASLQQLRDTLAQLQNAHQHFLADPSGEVTARVQKALENQDMIEAQSLQYEYVLARTDAGLLRAKDRVTEIRREVDSLTELFEQAKTHQRAVDAEGEQSEAQLRLLKEHLASMRGKREVCKRERVAMLREKHSEVDEEWIQAKADKAKSMAIKKNIAWLNDWLERQRNVRKVLRLHMGLEELAMDRFDRLVNKIIASLNGGTVDQALTNFQDVIAKNKSLLQEAEYKLGLQALYERKVSALAAELKWVQEVLTNASPKDFRQRIEKSEIHFPEEVGRMKTAEHGLKRVLSVKESNKMIVTKVIAAFDTLLALLHSLDTRGEAAAPVLVKFQSSVPQAFLLLDKRLQFLLTVTAQRLKTCELIRSLRLEIIKQSGSVETLQKMLKSTPRMRDNRRDEFTGRMSSTHPSLKVVSGELALSKDLSSTRSFSSFRRSKKLRSLRNLYQGTFNRLSSPREYFTERMRLYKDFEGVKRTFGSLHKESAGDSTLELLFHARMEQRKLHVLTQNDLKRKSKEQKSEKSLNSERQRALLATARSYLSTRSETFSSRSKSSHRLK